MSLATQAASSTFDGAVQGARDLIEIHRVRNPHAGRRHGPDLTLNRSAIVVAVAAWQAYVEALTLAILHGSVPPAGSALSRTYGVIQANVENRVDSLSTPNSQNTVTLLGLVNFNPRPAWSFTFDWERQRSNRYGSMRSHATVTPQQAADELDAWLKVRHAVAHGNPLQTGQIYATQITGSAAGTPVVLRRDADRCVQFLTTLVDRTAARAHVQFP